MQNYNENTQVYDGMYILNNINSRIPGAFQKSVAQLENYKNMFVCKTT